MHVADEVTLDLFPDGGHCLLGSIFQVLRCRDGQAALSEDPLGLVHVGPWNTQDDTVQVKMTKKGLNKVEPDVPPVRCKNHPV